MSTTGVPTYDPEIPPPRPPEAASLRAQISGLDVGESVAKARRVTLADLDAEALAKVVENLRNLINPAVARAKRETGHEYAIENGDFLTRGRDMIVVLAVTRIN